MTSQAPPPGAAPLRLVREAGAAGTGRLLTIVIASYNHRRYLEEAFAAIERSSVLDCLSILFIDDGSMDDTIAFVSDYPFDRRLHVRVFAKGNAGLRDSLASGLALTETSIVAFIASDDLYEPEGLDAAVARLRSVTDDRLCWVCQASYLEGRDGEPVYDRKIAALLTSNPLERERGLSVEFPKPLLLQSTLFGVDLLREVGAWSDTLQLDDWPTFVKVAHHAVDHPVDMRPMFDVVLCRYRVHDGGIHHDIAKLSAMCLQVAETGVADRYRAECRSNVYNDLALIRLYKREFGAAAALFAKAVRTYPRFRTIRRPVVRLISATVRRLTRRN